MKTNHKRKIAKWQPPGECLACGSESGLLHHCVSSEKVVHGETFHVSHQGYECRDCGFTFLGPDEMDEAVRAAVTAYQKQHELLTAQELRDLRKKMKWSQADLARYSGLGIATIKRLELGCNVQTKANNAALVQCFSQDQPIVIFGNCEVVRYSDAVPSSNATAESAFSLSLSWLSLSEKKTFKQKAVKCEDLCQYDFFELKPC
jgi:putative zinc finger/helix-turn-helix YgiT family protein